MLWRQQWASPLVQLQFAGYADSAAGGSKENQETTSDTEGAAAAADSARPSGAEAEEQPTVEQLAAELREREKAVEELQAKASCGVFGHAVAIHAIHPSSMRGSRGAQGAACPCPGHLLSPPSLCNAQVNDLADSFKRSLAEMENVRQRTARQIENAQKFAVEVG
jgi:hypothetical protein